MFEADTIMAIGMGIFVLALVGAGVFLAKNKMRRKKNQRQAQILLRLLTPHTEKEIAIDFPAGPLGSTGGCPGFYRARPERGSRRRKVPAGNRRSRGSCAAAPSR
jgi:hypothetical protein